MISDIRLLTTFPRHPKVKKLRMRLSAEGVLGLLTLWLFARESRPDGWLTGMAEEDIELAAEWGGERGALVSALVELSFLDQTSRGFRLHNWAKHNPYSAGAKIRAEKAKNAAKTRWKNQRKNSDLNATSINKHCCEHDLAMPLSFPLKPLESTSYVESTNLEHSTSYRRPRFSTEDSEENRQTALLDSLPKGDDDEKTGDGFLAEVSRMHFRLFGYALKPLELKTLSGYPEPAVLAKYEEALTRKGSHQEVRFFSWIESGLKGGPEKPGLLKRLFGGADEDRARGYRVDVG